MSTLLLQCRIGWLTTQSAMTAPGSLDTTFGTDGKVVKNYPDDIS